jgi:hypothetical protein
MIPITEAMKAGKEPLRTFGDLMQFYQQKTSAPPDAPSPAKENVEPTPSSASESSTESQPVVEKAPSADDLPAASGGAEATQ